MKITHVLLLLMEPVSFGRLRHEPRLESRAVAHLALDLGAPHRAATESMTTMSTAAERTSVSAISSASSPVSGCATCRLAMSTPSLPA